MFTKNSFLQFYTSLHHVNKKSIEPLKTKTIIISFDKIRLSIPFTSRTEEQDWMSLLRFSYASVKFLSAPY